MEKLLTFALIRLEFLENYMSRSNVKANYHSKDVQLTHVLVTGGCGYIGSHAVMRLHERGFKVIVLDNLSTGFRNAIPSGVTFVEGDVGDRALLSRTFAQYHIDGIIHFAASIVVPESISHPLQYYRNNTVNTVILLEEAVKTSVKSFIFSSTAAVYGENVASPVQETSPTNPTNPYGMSKLMDEYIIRDTAKAHNLNYVILRYFNVAGADLGGRIGQRSPNATHLIKVACEVAVGKREVITIFGTDYPTKDGTAIRDYIHVDDLAAAHVLAYEKCSRGTIQDVFNCGYGRGYSVKEVLKVVNEVAEQPIVAREGVRRDGDVSQLVAHSQKIRVSLGWEPQFDSLKTIVSSALEWEKSQVTKSGP